MSPTLADFLAPVLADAEGLMALRAELTGVHPDVESVAMRERALDSTLAGSWSKEPVVEAHNYALKLLLMCEDYARSMRQLYSASDWVPIWGAMPVCRSLLEAAGRCGAMADPSIGMRSRVERYMNERLFGLHHVGELPDGAKDSAEVVEQRALILDTGKALGFVRRPHPDTAQAAGGKLASPAQFGTGRMGDLEAVRSIFRIVGTDVLPNAVYRWMAAGAHATAWVVEQPFKVVEHNPNSNVTSLLVGRSPLEHLHLWSAANLAYLHAAGALLELNGWQTDSWLNAARNSLSVMQAVRAGLDPTS